MENKTTTIALNKRRNSLRCLKSCEAKFFYNFLHYINHFLLYSCLVDIVFGLRLWISASFKPMNYLYVNKT